MFIHHNIASPHKIFAASSLCTCLVRPPLVSWCPPSCSRNYEHFDTPLIRNIAKYEWNVSQWTALSASEHNRRTQLPGTTKVHSNKTSYYYRNQLKKPTFDIRQNRMSDDERGLTAIRHVARLRRLGSD